MKKECSINFLRLIWVCFAAVLGVGCTQTGLTKPTRSATEQLLLSTAADRALAQADWTILNHKKVYIDRTYFDSIDKEYVVGSIRDYASSSGALLVTNIVDADLVLEPRSGALSIDASSSIIGLPASAAPVPLAGAVNLPEIALYKSEKQYSIAKFAILIYERESKEHLTSTGPLVGRANIKYFKFLGFIAYTKTTVPERKTQHKEKPAN